MTKIEKDFHSQIKRTLLNFVLSYGFLFIVSLVAFYFTTRERLTQQEEQIKEIKDNVDYLIRIHINKSVCYTTFPLSKHHTELSGKIK